ncbi:hypothetical protein [Sphingobacterium sp. SYP-B4668]|uniref:hypothetical protein n=1 Tax=Sphingobacterium sp. SYP-B4668 TaxID=2996035 RepID=UPI0022DD038B|nr:hypothetical protein [Sphingobacterium sp. SYP-B4668]
MEEPKSKLQVIKLLAITLPTVFVMILIWLTAVYIGGTYFESEASAEQFLLWILSGAVICIGYPIASRQISRLGDFHLNRKITHEVQEVPKFDKSDWLFFLLLHAITIPLLLWVFSDLQHHVRIYDFFVDKFGRNYKGAPNFPIVLAFVFGTFLLLSLFYVLFLKIKYGTFNEPKDLSREAEKKFRQKQGIYFSFVASTSLTVMLLYYLKIVLLV